MQILNTGVILICKCCLHSWISSCGPVGASQSNSTHFGHKHSTVCSTTSVLMTENVFISTRWPSWEAVRDFPEGKSLALSLERQEATEPGHFICYYLLVLSEFSSHSRGAVHVCLTRLVCWLHFSFPVKGFLLCKLLYMKTTYCSERLGYTSNHTYLT